MERYLEKIAVSSGSLTRYVFGNLKKSNFDRVQDARAQYMLTSGVSIRTNVYSIGALIRLRCSHPVFNSGKRIIHQKSSLYVLTSEHTFLPIVMITFQPRSLIEP